MRSLLATLLCVVCTNVVFATPPEYASFKRTQSLNPDIERDELLRIWMVDIGQGDGMVIQLPSKYNYDADPDDGDPEKTESIEIVIDGGSMPSSESSSLLNFIQSAFPNTEVIEYSVITHHDADHVRGLINLMQSGQYSFETVFHNGLASYKPGTKGFPKTTKPKNAIVSGSREKISRAMAFYDDDKNILDEYLIEDLTSLKKEFDSRHLHGVYEKLAEAVLDAETETFSRAFSGSKFINEFEKDKVHGIPEDTLDFELIWPLDTLKIYKDWSHTINGNSLTFRLEYGEFSMLFMGDHNTESQEAFLEHLKENNSEATFLECDVYKVPHHGSKHYFPGFINHKDFNPVISVASMGSVGFKSKQLRSNNWEHPSDEVIKLLGGPHRVYHTYIHEKPFKWKNIKTKKSHSDLVERSHILIETDGTWFRIVELDSDLEELTPPAVKEIRRTNGTRWIHAENKD